MGELLQQDNNENGLCSTRFLLAICARAKVYDRELSLEPLFEKEEVRLGERTTQRKKETGQ